MQELTSALSNLPEICEKPHQSKISFPKREFGKTSVVRRSFQSQWFEKWQWLHYNTNRDVVFCHTCVAAIKSGRVRNLGTGDLAFVSRGYWNWKDATGNKGAFNTHERNNTHKMAVDHLLTLPSTTYDVGEMLSYEHAREKLANRDYLFPKYLARQGMAMRGDLDEIDGNFTQLLMLRSIDDPAITMQLEKKQTDIQVRKFKMRFCPFLYFVF